MYAPDWGSRAYQQRIISQWSGTIGKFLRSIHFSFCSFYIGDHFASVIILHRWSFCIGVRSFCSGYRSFCNLVCLIYFQLFILWLRPMIFTTIIVRSSILICSMNILFVLPNCIFLPYPPPIYMHIYIKDLYFNEINVILVYVYAYVWTCDL